MSEEQQDAVIGRLVREHREAENKLDLLRAEAKRIAEVLSKVGDVLARAPENVVFEGQGVSTRFAGGRGQILVGRNDSWSADKLQKLVSDYRDTLEKIQDYESQLTRFGISMQKGPGVY